MYIDFDINNYNTVQDFIADIVYYNNYLRLNYALKSSRENFLLKQ